jgi:hypothetical protein
MQPKVIAGVPVDAVRREVEGIVTVIGVSWASRASCRRLIAGRTAVDVKPAATDEGDRLAQGSRYGGEKTFIIMKRHLRIPSPFGDQEEHRRRASPPAREHIRCGKVLAGQIEAWLLRHSPAIVRLTRHHRASTLKLESNSAISLGATPGIIARTIGGSFSYTTNRSRRAGGSWCESPYRIA